MIQYKKKLSQNFFIDDNVKNKIIKYINIKKNDNILEIGSGTGAFSYKLMQLSKNFVSIEIDKNLFINLKNKINKSNTKIYNENIINFDFKNIIKKYKKLRIFGSIPYKISSQIILKLIKFYKHIKDIHFVIQKELANKLKNNLNKNSFAVYVKNYFDIKIIFNIKKTCFYPKPKVESSFIKIVPIKNNKKILNKKLFENILKNIYKKNYEIKFFKKYINIKKKYDLNIKNIIRISNFNSVCD